MFFELENLLYVILEHGPLILNFPYEKNSRKRNKIWEMLTGAPGALVKDIKKGNYIVIIALKTV